MSLVEDLRQQSDQMITSDDDIVTEISEYFEKYLNSNQFETDIKDKLSHNSLAKRQSSIDVEFWPYYSGCSDTHWRILRHWWYNPETQNTKCAFSSRSHTYKNRELRDIQDKIGNRLMTLLRLRLLDLGFRPATYPTNHPNGTETFHQSLEFSW